MSKLNRLREEFPHLEDRLYVNHAATAPLSRSVVKAIDEFSQQRHTGPIENFDHLLETISQARERSSRFLGGRPASIEFVPNTSTALHFLAEGIDWRPGDRVAVPACEFPANVYPFLHLQRKGVEVDFIPHRESTFTLNDVESVIRPSTRLISVSWVQFLSGFRVDLAELGALCRKHDIIYCVDAIQGLGALQLEVEDCGIDFVACGGHKWLMAPQGIGLLYCSERVMEEITPPVGWLHGPVDWDNFFEYDLQFHDDARRFRTGTFNGMGISGLNASLRLVEEAGRPWWESRVVDLAEYLAKGLQEIGCDIYGDADATHRSGIVTVKHQRAEQIFQSLKEQSVDAALRNGLLRFSPNAYNTTDEMARIIDAVRLFDE